MQVILIIKKILKIILSIFIIVLNSCFAFVAISSAFEHKDIDSFGVILRGIVYIALPTCILLMTLYLVLNAVLRRRSFYKISSWILSLLSVGMMLFIVVGSWLVFGNWHRLGFAIIYYLGIILLIYNFKEFNNIRSVIGLIIAYITYLALAILSKIPRGGSLISLFDSNNQRYLENQWFIIISVILLVTVIVTVCETKIKLRQDVRRQMDSER